MIDFDSTPYSIIEYYKGIYNKEEFSIMVDTDEDIYGVVFINRDITEKESDEIIAKFKENYDK